MFIVFVDIYKHILGKVANSQNICFHIDIVTYFFVLQYHYENSQRNYFGIEKPKSRLGTF
jgi:hypothetical protein